MVSLVLIPSGEVRFPVKECDEKLKVMSVSNMNHADTWGRIVFMISMFGLALSLATSGVHHAKRPEFKAELIAIKSWGVNLIY